MLRGSLSPFGALIVSRRAIRALTRLVTGVHWLRPVLSGRASQLVAVFTLLTLLIAGTAVEAFVPQAERIAGAIAEANAGAGRAQALRIELEMRIGEGPVVARGAIVTHPMGMARLELRGSGDLVEKHILHGALHRAGRNGERLPPERTRAFLPPLFLLQIDSAVSLGVALQAFGIHHEWVGLAPCDESDCYVLGDPDRVPPPPLAPPERQLDPASGGLPPTLWVDSESFDVRRMRLAGDVRVRFGPYVEFGSVRMPSWLQISDERGIVRFDVVAVSPVNAPASAFKMDWLVAPTTSPAVHDQFYGGPPTGERATSADRFE